MPDPPWYSRTLREQSCPCLPTCLPTWVWAPSRGARTTIPLLRSTGSTRAQRPHRKPPACAYEETCALDKIRWAELRALADAQCVSVSRLRAQSLTGIAAPAPFREPSTRCCSGRHLPGGAERSYPSGGTRQYRRLPRPRSSAFAKATEPPLRG